MVLLGWYLLFASTTAIVAVLELFNPVLSLLEKSAPEVNVVEYKHISKFVFLVFAFSVAPVIFLPCIIPSIGERFRISFLYGVLASNLTE